MNQAKLRRITPVQRATQARYGGHPTIELNFPRKNYTREDVEALIEIQQKKYKDEPLVFMPTLRLQRGYRSVKSFGVNEGCHIDLCGEESDTTNHFCIYVWRSFDREGGGGDEFNDCLYWAIAKSLNIDEFKQSWRKPTQFKRRLGLEREDKVGLDKLPLIENALKINIHLPSLLLIIRNMTEPTN
jgi:hypothetical protein